MASLIPFRGALNRIGNTIHNDIVQPIKRDVIRPTNNLFIQPAIHTASQAEHTIGAGVSGLIGLGAYGAGAATHNQVAQQNALRTANLAMNRNLQNSFLTAQQSRQGGTALIRPTLAAAGQIAPYTTPLGLGGIGAKAFIKSSAAIGGLNAGATALQGDLKPKDLAKSFITGAGTAGIIKGAHIGIKNTPNIAKAVRNTAHVDATPAPGRVLLETRRRMNDYADHLDPKTNYTADLAEATRLQKTTRAIGDKFNLTHQFVNGTRAERAAAIRDFTANYEANRKIHNSQGGYVDPNGPVLFGVGKLGNKTAPIPETPPVPYTKAPSAPGAVKRSWQTVNGVISQHGTAGKELAQRLSTHRAQSEIGQQAFLDKVPTVGKLKKGEFENFVNALDAADKGRTLNVSPKIKQAIGEWNSAIPEVRNRAIKAGLDVGDLGKNYFPRQYKGLFTNDKSMGKLAQQMVDTGKAKDLGDAIGKLQFMKNEYQKPFGNLEKTRQFDLPGYEKNHQALINYVSRSFDRITKAEQLGAKNETLKQLQGRMQQEGYNATPGSTVDKYIKIALGDVEKNTPAYKVSGGVRKFNALRSLSTAGLSNATQLTNTATVAGIGRTAKGVAKFAVSPKSRAQARQAGVVLDSSIQDLAKQGLGTGGGITRNIASPFFRQVEKFNRSTTAIVGKDYGNRLAKKGDVKQLREKFGVTGDIGKQLTRDQEIQVSRKLVEISQFKVNPMDLPGWVDSPMGKVVAQFRTFGYKQSEFMYTHVLREATKGNFLPLTRFVALGVPLGAGALALKGKIKGTAYTQPDESKASKGAKALAAVGGFGLPGSEGQNLYKSSQYGNTIGGIAGTFGGPTASLIAETSVNADKLRKGNSIPLKKEAVRSIPAIGPSIANRVFPKAVTPTPKVAKPGTNDAGSPIKDIKARSDKNPGAPVFEKTSTGSYAFKTSDGLVHEAASLDEARLKARKDAFEQSGANLKTINGQVFRRGADGSIGVTSKTKYDYQIGTATLSQQKSSGDVNGYISTAQKQLASIAKQLKDPSTDPLEALTLQNQANTLTTNIAKYKGYGGFTKPKAAKKGPSLVSSFRIGKVSTPKLSKITVKKTAYKPVKTRKLSVSKLPKFA